MNEHGVFIFTFDLCDKGIRLNSKLFMEHSLKYMEITAKKFFKSIELEELEFGRLEQGSIVKCGLATISKPIFR